LLGKYHASQPRINVTLSVAHRVSSAPNQLRTGFALFSGWPTTLGSGVFLNEQISKGTGAWVLFVKRAFVDKILGTPGMGLEWLDLSETNNLLYSTVSAQLSAGEQFEGWRYAAQAHPQYLELQI